MKVRHILVATAELAATKSPALDKAAAIARKSGATITLFHSIYSPYVAGERFYSPDALQKDIEAAVNVPRDQLARMAAPLEKGGLKVRVRVRWDYPVYESLVREVMREKIDLVVAESDRGQVIGRGGRGAHALRTLLRAATGPRSEGGLGLRIVD